MKVSSKEEKISIQEKRIWPRSLAGNRRTKKEEKSIEYKEFCLLLRVIGPN